MQQQVVNVVVYYDNSTATIVTDNAYIIYTNTHVNYTITTTNNMYNPYSYASVTEHQRLHK